MYDNANYFQDWSLQVFLLCYGMNISAVKIEMPTAIDIHVTSDTLSVELNDGRTICIPLGWYPRLEHANEQERKNWRFIGNGH